MADDTNICDVVLYYLNSFHMYEELKGNDTPPVPSQSQEAVEKSNTWTQPHCGEVGTIRGKCQPQLFLQQGVEKLGSGSVQCHCRHYNLLSIA